MDKKLFEWKLKGFRFAGFIDQWTEKDDVMWQRLYAQGQWKWAEIADEYELINDEYVQVRNVYYRLGKKCRYLDLT
jgi:hypothetical protein